jgi:hypothetical protein
MRVQKVKLSTLFETKKSALVTTIIGFQVGCALPEWLYFTLGLHSDNKLTMGLAIYAAVLCLVANLLVSILFWVTVVEPIRTKKARNKIED